MWVRGLKHNYMYKCCTCATVAPHVGAWIETLHPQKTAIIKHVAPHVGAWIETSMIDIDGVTNNVAPHVGAWIETSVAQENRHT